MLLKMQRFLSLGLLGLALISTARSVLVIQSASEPQPPSLFSIGASGGANAKIAGRLFDIDGRVEYFAGTNAWWLGHLSVNSDVDTALDQIVSSNYKIVRVWGFGDVNTIPDPAATDPNKVYFQLLNSTGSFLNFGPDGIQRLDYVVSSAEKHGVKLVLNFVNNWSDLGGIAAYNAAFGGNATTWFTDAQSQEVYKAYIQTIVTRYSKSSAIFAWELANEPRCHGCPTSVVTDWATSISAYIKSLDPDHLVTLGDEGWFDPSTASSIGDGSYAYSGAEGVSFPTNLQIPTLDYGVFHLYPDSWGYNYTWGSTWIEEHDAVGMAAGKPVVLEEYGSPFPNNHSETEAPWQQTVLRSGVAFDQIWQFGTPNMSIVCPFDDNTIWTNDTEYALLGSQHAAKMMAKRVG